jgi:hypothetical protein
MKNEEFGRFSSFLILHSKFEIPAPPAHTGPSLTLGMTLGYRREAYIF